MCFRALRFGSFGFGASQSWEHRPALALGLVIKSAEELFLHLVIAGRRFFCLGGFEGTLSDSLFAFKKKKARIKMQLKLYSACFQ